MAVGEPPNRTKRYATKKDENAVIRWMYATLQGLSGGLIGAADPTGNMARNAGAFLPASTVQRTGAPSVAVQGVNQAAGAAYDRAATTADQALLAASVIPAVGARTAARSFARQGERVAGATLRDARIAQQQARSAAAVERATGIPSAMRGPDTTRMYVPPRPTQPAARFPEGRTPRTDDPRGTTPAGMPRRDLPTPPRSEAPRVDTRAADADGNVNVSSVIKNGLGRKGSKGLTKDDVSVTWDGTKAPNHQQFKKVDPKTGKKVPWPEGFAAAKKSWKTVQTKSNPVNPNATQSRVAAEVEGMTPQEYARFQMQRGVAADPNAAATRVGRANEAELAGMNEQASMRRLMETPPPGANPRPASRPMNPGQGADRARGPRPTRRAGESQADWDARLKAWNESRSVANLSKTRKSLQKPKQRSNESKAAYDKRVAEWRKSLDEGSDTYGNTRASQTLQGERARVDAKLREAQPRAVSPDDPALGRFPRNPFDTDYIPSGPTKDPVGRVDPFDLPRFTPTRGKGSTRLRNVGKTADESPRSNVADKPTEVKKPKTRKKTKNNVKKPSTKSKKSTKQSKATDQETVTDANTASKELVPVGRSRGNENTAPRQREPIELTTRPVERPVPARRPSKVSTRPRGRKTGGSSAEGSRVFRMGATGKDVAVRQGSSVAVREAEKASGVSRRKKWLVRGAAASAVGLAGGAVGVEFKKLSDAEKAAEAAVTQTSAKTEDKKDAPEVLRDKYGRKITREEFDRREAYRKKLEGMSEAERKEARKKEMKRREKWRKSVGKQLFKKQATKTFRNLDLREGVSSRKVNAEMMAAQGGGGNRQAAMDVRKKYQRKKKD